jgi:hypothetical protein
MSTFSKAVLFILLVSEKKMQSWIVHLIFLDESKDITRNGKTKENPYGFVFCTSW